MASQTPPQAIAEIGEVENQAPLAATGKAKAKARGRPKAANRPRIDLDEEISEANRLAEVSRKMLQAAKSVQKNNRRTKQRLVRKAGKLSAEDLERMAVLKRCGLYGDQEGEEAKEEDTASGRPAEKKPGSKRLKMSTAAKKIEGAGKIFGDYAKMMESTEKTVTESSTGSSGSSSGPSTSSSSSAPPANVTSPTTGSGDVDLSEAE